MQLCSSTAGTASASRESVDAAAADTTDPHLLHFCKMSVSAAKSFVLGRSGGTVTRQSSQSRGKAPHLAVQGRPFVFQRNIISVRAHTWRHCAFG